ncbi:protein kinase domain-containing protein [Catenuloplanes indicus]
MGRVWLARDEVLHRDVAIKELVPPPGLTVDERREMRERSLREARAIARLNNINVVRVFDVLRTDGDPWIVMEYVASRSLQDILADVGPVAPARGVEIGLGMLNALRAAHRAGVVHRDVKPGNVLIGEDGRVVLTDFGLATVPGDPNVTRTGLVLGSPAYIAPERARDGTAGPQADLWSLGATLYAAVEGQSPYARPSAIGTLAALATEPPPVARNAGPLRPVLAGLLRKDPTERLSAEEAERMLMRAAGRKSRAPLNLWQTPRRGPGGARIGGDTQSSPAVPAPRPPLATGPRSSIAPVTGSHPPIFSKGRAPAAENKPPLDATRLDGTPVGDATTRIPDRDATTRIDPRTLARTEPAAQDTTTRITGGHLLGGRDATTRIDPPKRPGAAGTSVSVTPGAGTPGGGSQSNAAGGTSAPDETTVVPPLSGADASRPGSIKPGSAEPDAADPGAAGVAASGSATAPAVRNNPRIDPLGTGASGAFPVISGFGGRTAGPVFGTGLPTTPATSASGAPAATERTGGTGSAAGAGRAGATGTAGGTGSAPDTGGDEATAEKPESSGDADSTGNAGSSFAAGSTDEPRITDEPATGDKPNAGDAPADEAGSAETRSATADDAGASADDAEAATTDADASGQPATREAAATTPAAAGDGAAETPEAGSETISVTGATGTGAEDTTAPDDTDGTTIIRSGPADATSVISTPAGSAAPARTPDGSEGSAADSDWARAAWARTNPDATAVVPQSPVPAQAAKTGRPNRGDGKKTLGAPLARFARSAPRDDYDDRTQVVGTPSAGYDDYDEKPAPSGPSRLAADPRLWVVIALVIAVIVAVALIVPRLTDDDGENAAPAPTSPAPAPSATPSSAAPRPTGSPAPGVPALTMPAGWRTYDSPNGWSVPIPATWQANNLGSSIEFRETGGGGRYMLITQMANTNQDAKAAVTGIEQERRYEWEQYQLIKIESVDYFDSAADWEFAYGPPGNYRNHVLIRHFVTAPDRAYQIYWGTPDNVWNDEENQRQFDLIVALFKPDKD